MTHTEDTLRAGGEHIADIVTRLNALTLADAVTALEGLPFDRAVEVLDRAELARVGQLLTSLANAGALLSAMSADRAAAALRDLDGPDRTALLSRLDFETAAGLKQLLAYAPDTAGALMTTEFVSVPVGYTAAQTLIHLREEIGRASCRERV